MSLLRKVLGVVAYIAIPGSTILASTGVGVPAAAALAALGLAAGTTLHFMDNPKDAKAAADAGTSIKDAIAAVKAAKPK
jgi:hypothetical protein